MTNEQQWAERVRAWRVSGQSKADFCRNAPYTPAALGYWVKRIDHASTTDPAKAPPVRLARVVRTRGAAEEAPMPSTRVRSESSAPVVVEVVAVRAMVPKDLIGTELDAVIASLTRGWGGGRT